MLSIFQAFRTSALQARPTSVRALSLTPHQSINLNNGKNNNNSALLFSNRSVLLRRINVLNSTPSTSIPQRCYSNNTNDNNKNLSWLPESIKSEISTAIIHDVFRSIKTYARLKQAIEQLITLKMAPTKEMVDKMFEVLLPHGRRLSFALEIRAKLAKHRIESSPLIELPIKIATTVGNYTRGTSVIRTLTEYIKHNGSTPSEDVIRRVSEFYKTHNRPALAAKYVQDLVERHRRKASRQENYKKTGLTYLQMIELAIVHTPPPVTRNKIIAYIRQHFREHVPENRNLLHIVQAAITKRPDLFVSQLLSTTERFNEMQQHPQLYADPLSKRAIIPRKHFQMNKKSPSARYTPDTAIEQVVSDVSYRALTEEQKKTLQEFYVFWDATKVKKSYNNWELLAAKAIKKMNTKKGTWSINRFLHIATMLQRPKTYFLAHSHEEFRSTLLPYFMQYVKENNIVLAPNNSGRPKKIKPTQEPENVANEAKDAENKS